MQCSSNQDAKILDNLRFDRFIAAFLSIRSCHLISHTIFCQPVNDLPMKYLNASFTVCCMKHAVNQDQPARPCFHRHFCAFEDVIKQQHAKQILQLWSLHLCMMMSVFKRIQILHTFKITFCLFWQNWVNATHEDKCCRYNVMISRITLCLAIRRALFFSRVRNFQPFKACRADFCRFRQAHTWAHSYLQTTYSTYRTNFEFVQSRHSDSRAGDATLASDNTSTRTLCPSEF